MTEERDPTKGTFEGHLPMSKKGRLSRDDIDSLEPKTEPKLKPVLDKWFKGKGNKN